MHKIESREHARLRGDVLTCLIRPEMAGKLLSRFAFSAIVLFAIATAVFAQSPEDLKRAAPVQPVNPAATKIDPAVTAGPTIYITDTGGRLATVTLGTYAVHIIGHEGVVLTDIGFNPKDGQLYGVSFTSFYRVSTTTGKATFIGSLGISDANALVFNAQGVAYTEGVNSSELYTINTKTGHVSPVGSSAPFKSAGDLTFFNNGVVSGLVLSSYYQSSLTSTTPDTLALLNPSNGKPLAYAKLSIANLFGIVCTGKGILYGFAGLNVYQLFPSQSVVSKRAVLLKSLAGKGISQIYGAAYKGYFLF